MQMVGASRILADDEQQSVDEQVAAFLLLVHPSDNTARLNFHGVYARVKEQASLKAREDGHHVWFGLCPADATSIGGAFAGSGRTGEGT